MESVLLCILLALVIAGVLLTLLARRWWMRRVLLVAPLLAACLSYGLFVEVPRMLRESRAIRSSPIVGDWRYTGPDGAGGTVQFTDKGRIFLGAVERKEAGRFVVDSNGKLLVTWAGRREGDAYAMSMTQPENLRLCCFGPAPLDGPWARGQVVALSRATRPR